MNWALVTGASKGIGRAIAVELAERGWSLVLVARSEQLLSSLQEELVNKGVDARVIVCDLTLKEDRRKVSEQIDEWKIPLLALVNNAGIGSNGAFINSQKDREVKQIELNVLALVELTHLFLPVMKEQGKGYVLNIASCAGFQPGPYMAVYFATKAFVLHFSEALAVELEPLGISVTAHCPGATDSEFAGEAGNDTSLLFAMGTMSSAKVARHAVTSMLAKKRVAVPGFQNWLGTKLVPLLPRKVVLRMASWLNKPSPF